MIARVLRSGDTGDDVALWQVFLIGFFDTNGVDRTGLIVNGEFDVATESHTTTFQCMKDVICSGVVDADTLTAALQDGIELDRSVHISHDRTSPSWPMKPDDVRFLSENEKMTMFGGFKYRHAPTKVDPEAIVITRGDDFTIKNVHLHHIVNVVGFPQSGDVLFNAKCSEQLVALFDAWHEFGLTNLIKSWAGSYVPRFVRGSRTVLSSHAWGTAFDVNAQWNPLGVRPALVGQKGSVRELVEIAAQFGFTWGGWIPNRPDGMHFEAYKLV